MKDMYLKELCQLPGVSGDEQAVREFIIHRIEGKCDEWHVDGMGNVIAVKHGGGDKKVMLTAHMDEVGLIVSSVTDTGFLKFQTVGGIDPRVLVSKRVLVGKNRVPGLIGYKAVHLQDAAECKTAVKTKQLYIDIGAPDRAAAEKLCGKGDYVTFDSGFVLFGDDCIKAKALDDRAGCAILLDVVENAKCDCELYCVFTVQEEVGLRGATVAAYDIRPDIAVILETTTCSDVYGTEPKDYATRLGEGPALSILDRSTIYDKPLTQAAARIAGRLKIPVQYKQTALGGNEGGAVQRAGTGTRTVAFNLPGRYIHSPCCVISKKDYDHLHRLLYQFLQEVDQYA